MIIDEHFASVNDIKISSASSRYTDSSKQIRIAPFERKIRNEDDDKEFVLRYKLLAQKVYRLTDPTVKISFNANMNGDSLKQCTTTQSTDIKFEDLKEKLFESTLDLIYDFSEFLTLCIGEKVNTYNIEVLTKSGNKILISWKGMILNEDSDKTLHKILVPYQFIQDNFQQCLESWYEKNEKLKPIINYLVEAYEKVFYIPMSFLKVIQAFEAFSIRMRNNYKIDSEEHEKRVKYIIDKTDNEEYKPWLEERLRYSNEPNLNSRIKDLFTELDFIIHMSSEDKKGMLTK
ncbi:HEPN domain-containing protein [Clostridium sp. ATCC 25772]|uniref:HEPN domain-containing protein n=1 Tax=Clostridium sp. ATCC 25772 TaxID=1676991 RepID=UPI000781D8F3|nr:HEPN domain-containing protein [Clostridium sp. ATCC 25772]